MLNINSLLMAELEDKAYRDAYVGSQIRMTLPLQIRGLREGFDWTQSKLASEANMAQPRISELETPGERRLTIETLLRLASAFDIALQVRFLPFSELVEWSEGLNLNKLRIKTFSEEVQEAKKATGRRRRLGVRTTENLGIPPRQFNLIESQASLSKGTIVEMPKQGVARLSMPSTGQSGAKIPLTLLAQEQAGTAAKRCAYGNP